MLLLAAILSGGLTFSALEPKGQETEVSPEAATPPLPEVFARLDTWMRRYRRAGGMVEGDDARELRSLVRELRLLHANDATWRRDALLSLLDVLGESLQFERGTGPRPSVPLEPGDGGTPFPTRARILTEKTVQPWLDDDAQRFLQREVLMLPRVHPTPRRLAAIHLLGEQRDRGSLVPLLAVARDPDQEVREMALEVLSGWNDEAVHSLFLDLLTSPESLFGNVDLAMVEAHFAHSGPCAEGRTAGRILRFVRRELASGDWRTAVQAVAISPVLSDDAAIPVLLEALETWIARGKEGNRSRRVEYDIAHALEKRSGRTLGTNLDRWKLWWKAVQTGEIPPPDQEKREDVSRSSFFGLRPTSDRVTFVIDRSGSMETPFGTPYEGTTDGHASRYSTAIDQMENFLRAAGPSARFNVVLFWGGSDMWRSRLAAASEENLRAARSWLLARRPKGDTLLRGGVSRAMELMPDGRVNLKRLEADTIIVLCDGETTDGPGWVEPLLRRNYDARLMFHGVQIGSGGDGTLQALASETGGQFVQIDG